MNKSKEILLNKINFLDDIGLAAILKSELGITKKNDPVIDRDYFQTFEYISSNNSNKIIQSSSSATKRSESSRGNSSSNRNIIPFIKKDPITNKEIIKDYLYLQIEEFFNVLDRIPAGSSDFFEYL